MKILHVHITMLYVNIKILHADINKSHANIIILHVDIIYLAYRGQKNATIVLLYSFYHIGGPVIQFIYSVFFFCFVYNACACFFLIDILLFFTPTPPLPSSRSPKLSLPTLKKNRFVFVVKKKAWCFEFSINTLQIAIN